MSNQSTSSSLSEPAPSSTGKGAAGLGEIVVFVDGRTATPGILEFAGVLAQEHGAHLTAVFMQPEPAVTPPETFARGKGMLSVIEVHRERNSRGSRRTAGPCSTRSPVATPSGRSGDRCPT